MRKSILTVTTPPVTTDLTDVETVRAELGDSGDNANIARWIKWASAVATRYCKRYSFAEQSVSEQFRTDHTTVLTNFTIDAPTHARLQLSLYPVTAIASVSENGTVLDPSLYEVAPDTGLLLRLSAGSHSRQWAASRIVVAYTGGYKLPPDPAANLPDEISDAVVQLVATRSFWAPRDPTVKSKNVVGVLETEFWPSQGPDAGTAGAMPMSVAALLDPFVRVDI